MDLDTLRHRYAGGYIRVSGILWQRTKNIEVKNLPVYFHDGQNGVAPYTDRWSMILASSRYPVDYMYCEPDKVTLNLAKPKSRIIDFGNTVVYVRNSAARNHKRCAQTQNTSSVLVLEDFLTNCYDYRESIFPRKQLSLKLSHDLFSAWCSHTPSTYNEILLNLSNNKTVAQALTRYFWISISYTQPSGYILWYRTTPVADIDSTGRSIRASKFFYQEIKDVFARLHIGDVYVFV